MKLLIDISKDRYDEIMAMDWVNGRRFFDEELRAIHDGIPQRTERWIPVSERLPEIHNFCKKYLVTYKYGQICTAFYTETNGRSWWSIDDVEAWMPLPEPYKSEIPTGAEGSDKE